MCPRRAVSYTHLYIAETITDPDTGEVVVKANHMCTPKRAAAVMKVLNKTGRKSVKIRTVLSCKSHIGVCAKCYGAKDVYKRQDRTRKVPVTVLIRALGFGTNAEILELFGEEPKLLASFGKDTSDNYQDGLLELYKKIRPGEPLSVDSAESLLNSMFFDPRRYDLSLIHI